MKYKKNTLVCVNLITGDVIVGKFQKANKDTTTIKDPVKLASESGSNKPIMFIKHNLLGDDNKLKYHNSSILMIYPVAEYISKFYAKALHYLSTYMQEHMQTEFEQYSAVIDRTIKAKQTELDEFRQTIIDQLKEVAEVPVDSTPKKKPTLH